MNSMTGFSRAERKDSDYQVTVEIKTVNSKKSDISFNLPPSLNVIEPKLREAIRDRLARGRIDVYVDFKDLTENGTEIVLDENLVKNYIGLLKKISELDESVSDEIDLMQLANMPEIFDIKEGSYSKEELEELILPVFREAISELVKSRALEGENLKKDILEHAGNIKADIEVIDRLAPEAIEKSKEDLSERIKSAFEDFSIDEGRVLTELAILADKLAIDEEITRLKSHIKLLVDTCELEEPIGRKLDFTLQELNREANTIASKTDSIDIINTAVELKTEIEKIREQVQNVE